MSPVQPPDGEAGEVWHVLAMAGVGMPVRGELARRLTLADAKAVVAAAKQREKSVQRLVLDLRDRADALEARARHRATLAAVTAKRVDAARGTLTIHARDKAHAEAEQREACAVIDAASPEAVAEAARDVLAKEPESMARAVSKRCPTPEAAARHPFIVVRVAKLLRERQGVHVVPAEEAP